jgi:subtilisin family serine protease
MRATPLMLAIALGLGAPVLANAMAPESAGSTQRAEDRTTWIVQFEEPAAASFRGFTGDSRRPKLAATSPSATGARKYDSRSQAARDYVSYLGELRRIRLADASARLGRPLLPRYVYAHAINGLSLELTAAEAAVIRAMPGVRAISPEFHRYPQTDRGPLWINADDIWNGTLPGIGTHKGEGQVIGVIDTGINRAHTAFAGTGISNPAGQVYGYCITNAAACNTKVIGLYDFIANTTNGRADPTDTDGHGTHTAATSGGNPFSLYTGVAPQANIIAYKACPGGDGTSCNGTALIASIDQAVADGVDVINYSIGGGPIDPWFAVGNTSVDDTEAFLAAREAGIIVAAAAGNDGPDPGTHGNPANSPWVLGVAAASHDRTSVASADFLAQFSGRGPVIPFGVVKPDVTAPGVNIRSAGIANSTAMTQMSGTSMATPHVAGAAALIKSAHPTWTADQIMSALVLTARSSVKIDGVTFGTPHEQGAGMIDVALAVRAGLYLEVPANAFRNARADVWTGAAQNLNLPSLGHASCFRTCSLTRTFKLMPGATGANYNISVSGLPAGATVTPNVPSFTSSAAGTPITFNVNVDNAALADTWVYGTVTLTNTSGDGRPNLKLPIAIYATPFEDAATEAGMTIQSRTVLNERGFFDIDVGGMLNLPNARFGASALAAPVSSTETIVEDPTNDDAYDNTAQNYVRLVTVPAGTAPVSLSVRTTAASGDIDLYVGQDLNANGRPDESEEQCLSAGPDANESCELELNAAGAPRSFWVMAQNWDNASATTIEHVVVSAVDADSTTLRATGPGNVPAGTPFKIRVAWDDPTLLPGATRIGFVVVKPSPTGAAINVPVRLTASGGLVPAPFGLTPGTARTTSLAPTAAHERLYVDVPPGVTQMTLRTTNGTGSVSLYAARIDQPAGPVVANAPARGAASHSATAAGANQTIVIPNPAPGRWYLTPVNTGAGNARVDVSATFDTIGAVPTLKRGSYYNPARGGHGIFLYPSGPDHALLWYTYLQDGTPTWYYAQGTQPTGSQVFNGTVYRAAWNGTSRTLEAIGNIVLTPRSATGITISYNIDGFTGSETLDTFLTGCPTVNSVPLDVSAHWFDTVSPGYGYSVQVNPSYEFLATFVYDGIGVPRFLAAERGGTFAAANSTLQLDQLAGFAPLGTHAPPVRTTVGSLTRTYGPSTIVNIGTTATFVNGVPGTWARNAAVTRLSDQPQGCL